MKKVHEKQPRPCSMYPRRVLEREPDSLEPRPSCLLLAEQTLKKDEKLSNGNRTEQIILDDLIQFARFTYKCFDQN